MSDLHRMLAPLDHSQQKIFDRMQTKNEEDDEHHHHHHHHHENPENKLSNGNILFE